MKTFRFIHTADWHASSDPVKQKKLKDSLDQILDFVKTNEVEAIIHCGDVWDSSQDFNGKGGVPIVFEYLRKLSKHVNYIFIVKGNNSHDAPGSIALLHQLEPNILAYEYPVCLLKVSNEFHNYESIKDIFRDEQPIHASADYIISLIPYPTKASFISDQSIDNNNSDFIEKFEGVFELIGDVTKEYSCPKILGAHLNVVGSRLSSGQSLVSQDIMVAPSTLDKAGADYVALGHIHLDQMIAPFKYYSGSIYNKNWGETEQKSFKVIELQKHNQENLSAICRIDTIPLVSARPMVTVNAEFCPNDPHTDFIYDNDLSDESYNNAEVRLRIKIKESDNLIFMVLK